MQFRASACPIRHQRRPPALSSSMRCFPDSTCLRASDGAGGRLRERRGSSHCHDGRRNSNSASCHTVPISMVRYCPNGFCVIVSIRHTSTTCLTQNWVRGSVPDISCTVALVAQHVSESRTPSQPLCAFLSFVTKDKVLVDGIRNELELQQPSIELLDHAAHENYEADWKHNCARKIHRSAVLICLVGTSTHESEAVTWEIGRGLALGKRVVAVNLTRRPVRVPAILARNAIEPLPSSGSLISFVAELAPPGKANGRR